MILHRYMISFWDDRFSKELFRIEQAFTVKDALSQFRVNHRHTNAKPSRIISLPDPPFTCTAAWFGRRCALFPNHKGDEHATETDDRWPVEPAKTENVVSLKPEE
jgi:hypothetical protein